MVLEIGRGLSDLSNDRNIGDEMNSALILIVPNFLTESFLSGKRAEGNRVCR